MNRINVVSAALCSAILALALASCSKDQTRATLFKQLPAEATGIDFNNKIEELDTFNILTYEYIYNGGGVGIGDFNNDGLKDIFFAGNLVHNKMYLNKGNFAFTDVSETAQINAPGPRWNSGVAVIDINNDGWLDLYVTATMRPRQEERYNMLFVNNGLNADGIPTFTEKAGSYGIADGGFGVMAAFLDFDKDDDLDLYILINQRMNNVPTNFRPKINDGTAANNDKFYRNNGDGTFTDITNEAGITHEGYGLGLAVADVNKDGWPDIYVSNDYLSNDILYINNGNGSFTNRIADYIGHQSQFSMGNDVSDINNDGFPDIVTTDMLPETNARKKTTIGNKSYSTYINNEQFGYEYQYVRNMLHLNNGLDKGIRFSEIGQLAGVHQTEWSWSPLFIDADNDGYKDLFITNGFPKDITDKDFANYRADVGQIATARHLNDSIPVIEIPNYVFRNNGTLEFTDVTKQWGFGAKSFSNGAAFADLDNDGDLDYVTNNINSTAFVYQNTLNDKKEGQPDSVKTNSYLDIDLKGSPGNRMALGSKVTLYTGNRIQYYEESVYRGYLSSVDQQIHFGLGSSTAVDSVVVIWPDGGKSVYLNPPVNKVISMKFEDRKTSLKPAAATPKNTLFTEVSNGIAYKHVDEDYIDFNTQRTIPHKFSQSGPGLAVGDINGDGLDDLVIGGSVKHNFAVYLAQKDGKFADRSLPAINEKKTQEDEGLLLFDADNDNDLDLYVVSGGFEGAAPSDYRDRLYFNNGKGSFTLDTTALPHVDASGSCVRAADFDSDGDLDLFVGGRVVAGAYPTTPESYLLINDKGKFTNATASIASDLQKAGMITDAIWTDYDNDNKIDLVVAGEFMPVTFFHNENGKLVKATTTGIENKSGWWNSIAAGDFDNDGDIDYAVGNLGRNNNYQVSSKYPLMCYSKDFDGNGSIDPVMACYMRVSMDGDERKLFPVHFWDELNQQSPKFRRKFARYKQFSKVEMDKLFTPEELTGVVIHEANEMSSSYIENLGNGKFKMTALPMQAQVAPVNGMVSDDVNRDGNLDLVMIGNDYGNEVFAGRHDAFTGLVLLGNGDGSFTPSNSAESNFNVSGDGKALVKITENGRDTYVASQNKGTIKTFVTATGDGYVCKPQRDDAWCEIALNNGKKRKQEFYYGSGYLSQSGRKFRLSTPVTSLTLYSVDGKSRNVDVTASK